MLKTILYYMNMISLIGLICSCLFYYHTIPFWIQHSCLYLFFTTWFIEVILDNRWKMKPNKQWIFYGLIILFFLLAFLYWPWDGKHTYFQYHLERRLPLLGFGIVGILGVNNRYSRAAIINAMIITSIASILFIGFKAGWHNIFFSEERIMLISKCRIQHINAHMGYNFFLNSTIIGIWYLLFHADKKPALWQRVAYPIAAIIILLTILCTDGRSGFFIGLANVCIMIIIELCRYKKWICITGAIVAFSALIMLSSLHPRLSKESISYDLRYSYWKSATALIKQKPILGYGMSHAQEEFDQVNMQYVSESSKYYWTVKHHHYIDCHNQYLQTLLEFGIIGLILLLAIYISPLIICWRRREWWLALFFTIISMWQSIFDTFLTGQFNMLYCILLLMIINVKQDYCCNYLSNNPRK